MSRRREGVDITLVILFAATGIAVAAVCCGALWIVGVVT